MASTAAGFGVARVVDAAPSPDEATVTVPLPPARILDTRTGIGTGGVSAAIGADQTIDLQVTGAGGVPVEATGIVLNLTGTEATQASFITTWPTGETRPNASVLNVAPGSNLPNMITARLGAGGQLSIYNLAGSVHVLADVAGYLVPVGTVVTGGGVAGPPGPPGQQGPPGPTGPIGPQGIIDHWTITGVPTEPSAGGYAWAFNRPPEQITVQAGQVVFGTAAVSLRFIAASGQRGFRYAICSRRVGLFPLVQWGELFSWYSDPSQNNSIATNAVLPLSPGTYSVGPCSAVELTGVFDYNSNSSTTLMLLNA